MRTRHTGAYIRGLVLTSLQCLYYTYDNIALRQPAIFKPPVRVQNEWGPEKAVDGNTDSHVNGNSCAVKYDEKNDNVAWQVYLGKIKSIHSIKIHYRADAHFDYRTRFAGFSLYISNTTNREEGHLCYHNTEPLPPLIFSQICTVHGQFVIIYNERKPNRTYPNSYFEHAVLELCEVEVFGCKINYGSNCHLLCPQRCRSDQCDVTDGTCIACSDGFTGFNCTQECPTGTYGTNCSGVCSTFCETSGHCHHVTGYCFDGCQEGWTGDRCRTACDNGKYGRDCENTCGHCRGGMPCDKITGRCLECDPGYMLPICHDKCLSGMFGLNCTRKCGNCHNEEACNHETGYCTSRCADGWRSLKCDKECALSYYGENCSKSCSAHCKGGRLCHHVTGSCDQGCMDGFYGYTCESINPLQHINRTEKNPTETDEEKSSTCTAAVVSAVVEGVVIGLGGVAILVYFLRRGNQQLTSRSQTENTNDTRIEYYNARNIPKTTEMNMSNPGGDIGYTQIQEIQRNDHGYENTNIES